MSTYMAKAGQVDRKWYVLNAEGKSLGRVAAVAATLLRGKNEPTFTPHVDCGDNVVVINAEKVILTGNKEKGKVIYSYSGYPGGRHDKTAGELLAKQPCKLVEHAVKGMLPKNRLGAKLLGNLKVYAGSAHEQEAQQPKAIDINTVY